ncbi:MAG: 30S ribosome-binding factor RbfA [Thermoguttaceae bacterium]|nr:30S ribosome-binding factor RbfA [Thermoguttaceae bacterium]MDW8036877.1 30S ribosome-binding factor RbfA [Thermoguttaceae bacterium]
MDPTRRAQKLAKIVREVVGMAILRELKDPRIRNATVTYVEVSGDLRWAKVHVSVMGTPTEQQLTLQGLQSAAGFLQSKLRERVDTRYIPKLIFRLDQGVKKSIAVAQILKHVFPSPPDKEQNEQASEESDQQPPEDPSQTASEHSDS